MVSEKITQSIGLVVRSPRQPASEQLRLAYKITRIRSVPLLRELKKIKISWPGLNYTTAPGVLILHPSTPAIAPLDQAQLGS